MSEGTIRTEVHDRIFRIIIDNPAKKNAFSPQMMEQLSDALTELHNNDNYWVGVVSAEGKDFTAGLDMPKFFGPTAEKRNFREGNVDAFALQKRCRKPVVTAVQGIVFTIGIELMLAGDIVVGDNEPYSARASYEYTLTAHARSRAIPHCSLEVRQDLMDTPDKARAWGRRLAPAIDAAVAVSLKMPEYEPWPSGRPVP